MRDKSALPTAARLRELFSYEPLTGRLVWIRRPSQAAEGTGDVVAWSGLTSQRRPGPAAVGSEAGVKCYVDGVFLLAHRLIWCWVTGAYPVGSVKHLDGESTNNRWTNLCVEEPKCRRALPTQRRLWELFQYEPMTGALTRKVALQKGCVKAGDLVGHSDGRGYLKCNVDGFQIKVHRVIWCWMTGEWPAETIDHIDGVRGNNAWANLRAASKRVQAENVEVAHGNSSTGRRGVSRSRGKYAAKIASMGRTYHLGTYRTIEAAERAYLRAKAVLHAGWVPRDSAVLRVKLNLTAHDRASS